MKAMVGTAYEKGELPCLPRGLGEAGQTQHCLGKRAAELAALRALGPVDSVSSHPYRHPQTQIYEFPHSSPAQIFLLWFWKHFFHFKYILLHASIQQRFIEPLPKILCETNL